MSTPPTTSLSPRACLLALLAMLFVALLPFAAHFVTFHPDERHYTDAAAGMVFSGDFLTPRTADGELRLLKPVLTYWLMAPGYEVWGVQPLTSRLPFLLVTLLIVAATYELAQLVYDDPATSLVAAALMTIHAPLVSIGVNAIPEVPLTLCWIVAAYGFLGIMLLDEIRPRYFWAAYLGVGCGVAVKGLPLLLLAGYAVVFALVNPWRRKSWRELLHGPSLTCGIVMAGWWYIAMLLIHGPVALEVFLHDQVADRVSFSWLRVAKNSGTVIVGYVASLSPWLFAFAWPAARAWCVANNRRTCFTAFVIGWAVLMGIVIAVVERFALRYLLATTPLLLVLIAPVLRQLPQLWPTRAITGSFGLLACFATLLLLGMLCRPESWRLSLSELLVSFAMILFLAWLTFSRTASDLLFVPRTALAYLTLTPILFFALRPFALPDSGELLAHGLREQRLLDQPGLVFVGNPAIISKARVASRGDLPLYVLSECDDLAVPDYPLVLINRDDLAQFPASDYREVTAIPAGYARLSPGAIARAAYNGTLHAYLQSHRQSFVLLERRDGTPVGWPEFHRARFIASRQVASRQR